MTSTKEHLLRNVQPVKLSSNDKITIVGSGFVATAIASSILLQGISNNIVIVGRNEEKVRGEVLDFNHGKFFLKNASITGGTSLSLTEGSQLIIFAAGARRVEGESRLDLLQKNVDILKSLIAKLVQFSPQAVLLMVTNPVDVLSYVAWKLSGLPVHRVIGSGTHLDTCRFRYLMAQRLGVAVTSMNGWVIGEHGDTSIPVWSGVNVAGVRLRDINPQAGLKDDPENWSEVHQEVVQADSEVIKLKDHTSWGIGICCAAIASSILRCSNEMKAVSTMIKGLYGINKEVFVSLPCMVNCSGVASIVNINLSDEEKEKLRHTANLLDEIQKSIKF